ncbi:MAG: SDR family NAD(P)-dependent oxidoreductase [Rhodospirillaceae bacterium]
MTAPSKHAPSLASFGSNLRAVVMGASGGIGRALTTALEAEAAVAQVYGLSRTRGESSADKLSWIEADLTQEDTLAQAAKTIIEDGGPVHLVMVATGILHQGDDISPEKSWRALSAPTLETLFKINTIGPALAAKHFLPLLDKDRKSVFAALSARVGSIEDNRLGGWHAYRASKAALNMMIKTLSIELAFRSPQALCVGLHPGTVDTALSEPFQKGVADDKLFSPAQSAGYLLNVLNGLTAEDSGHVFAWDGSRIPA